MVWMFVVCLVGFAFVILSMAEMASMAPTCGGQYHASVPYMSFKWYWVHQSSTVGV
jgi:hypothetical protein